MASNKLSDVPIRKLIQMIRATERLVGPESQSVKILRRALEAKRQSLREARQLEAVRGKENPASNKRPSKKRATAPALRGCA